MIAHNREHDFFLKLESDNIEDCKIEIMERLGVHGWWHTKQEARKLIGDKEIYFSHNTH